MSFPDAVKACLNQYAGFSGRARRSEFWFFYLAYLLAVIVASIVGAVIKFPYLGILVVLALIVPMLAVEIRRLHDTGRSGWFILISLIPLIGPIVLLVFLVQDSQPQPNQYGASPKGVAGYQPYPA